MTPHRISREEEHNIKQGAQEEKKHTHLSNNHITPAPTLVTAALTHLHPHRVLVAELELELLKILLYNFSTYKGNQKASVLRGKNLQKPLRFFIR